MVWDKKSYYKKKQAESPEILCGCGCGETLKSLDKWGRPRSYVSGHNGRKYQDPLQYKREWLERNLS